MRLEPVTNLAIIGVCGIIAYSTLARKPTAGPTRSVAPVYAVGDEVGPLPDLDLSGSPKTLILVIRSGCKYCTESMPFYRAVATTLARPGSTTRLVAVSPEPVDVTSRYLLRHGLRVDQVVFAPWSSLKVKGTPTVVLADASGRVRDVWMGLLDSERQQHVLAAASPEVEMEGSR